MTPESRDGAAPEPEPEGKGGDAGLPVAVIGAGPVGLVAAAHLIERGETPLVLEAGGAVGASVREWAHVRLFSPWEYLTDPVSRRLLEPTGWELPSPEALPTGGELVERFLEPLAALAELEPRIHLSHRVVAVTRRGMDRVMTPGRDAAPFELVVRTAAGERRILARAVIDASGTWTGPAPVGSNGLPVPGERELSGRIRYGIPDALGRERLRYAGRRTLVVGSGHSAFNAVLELQSLRREEGAGEVVWAIRGTDALHLYGGGEADELGARGDLGRRLRRAVEEGGVRRVTGFRAARISDGPDGIAVHADDGRRIGPLDEIVVATGFRPDHSISRELRLGLDPVTESPVDLAPLIDPNVHSCGTVRPHGFEELAHPERDFYVVGMKSYGRAPTFLLPTGYEQVRSVVSALAGDLEAARAVELELPETGVCTTDAAAGIDGARSDLDPSSDSGCCGPESPSAGREAACCG